MAYNLGTAFMDFTSGVLEADKKNTKDNLIIRGEELKAKRDAIIGKNKSIYEIFKFFILSKKLPNKNRF